MFRTTPAIRSLVGRIPQQAKGFATEKQLKMRITGTKNIAKITKSMKMVSAAKLRGDQMRLQAGIPFAKWTNTVSGEVTSLESLDPKDWPKRNLIVISSTDKGLCGGVNSIMSRMTKQLINKVEGQGKNIELLVLGEKGRAQLRRGYGDKMVAALTDRSAPYTFDLASALTTESLSGEGYDAIHIIYNKFVSAIAYTPSVKTIIPIADPANPLFLQYEVEPEADFDTMRNFFEYQLATQVFYGLLENATSEQSSRMNAMENASKNAGDMINKLTLQYNRARQARITTELTEIISGAAALE